MKQLNVIRVSVSLTVVLAIGTAGSFFYARDAAALRGDEASPKTERVDALADTDLSADLLGKWKATARTTDYISPRVPI